MTETIPSQKSKCENVQTDRTTSQDNPVSRTQISEILFEYFSVPFDSSPRIVVQTFRKIRYSTIPIRIQASPT